MKLFNKEWKSLIFIIIQLLIATPIFAKNVVIEVSNAYSQIEVGLCKIKMPDLNSAIDYCNKYQGNQSIVILLKDDVNIINSSLVLNKTTTPIVIKAKGRKSVITSGKMVDCNDVIQKGDTLIFPYEIQCVKILANGKSIPLANTFSNSKSLRMFQSVRKIDDYNYIAKFPENEILKLDKGCDVFAYTRWQCYKLKVTDIDYKSNTASLSTMKKKAFYLTDAGTRYSIYNSKHVMHPGSFCWKEGKVYYLKMTNEDPSELSFSIPMVSTLMRINKCVNITFNRISFENAVLDDWYFQEVQGSALCSRAVHVEYSSNIIFKECSFHNNMGYSLAIGNHSSKCLVTSCGFTDLQGGGIILGMEGGDNTNAITINDNLFEGFGNVNVCCEAILCQRAHHVTITNNTICDGFYSGINLGWTWGFDKSFSCHNYVANNHIHHLMQGVLDDGGGIYTLGIQVGTIIENNYIHDIFPDKEMACLIYLDEGSSEIIVRNNICFASMRGVNESFGKNNVIHNNIIGFVKKWGVHISYPEKDSNLTISANTIFADSVIAIDSNIPKSGLFNNSIISVDNEVEIANCDLYGFMAVSSLYNMGYLNRKFVYGCKSRKLKNYKKNY